MEGRKRARDGTPRAGAIASTGSRRYALDIEELGRGRTATGARTRTGTRTGAGRRTGTVGRSRGRKGTVGRTATAREDDVYVVAVIENRAKEVGLAAYNLRSFHVELRQYSDTNCFVNTMTALVVFNPVEIIMSQTSAGAAMDRAIQDNSYLSDVQCSFIGRKYFNETYGSMACERLSAEMCPNLAASSTIPRYLALASCAALIKYVEHIQAIVFEPHSMRVNLLQNDGFLFVDVATIDATELIRSAACTMDLHTGKSFNPRKDSLLGVVDRTRTRPGKRFLRRTLLEPPADFDTITSRQNLVEELSSDETAYYGICRALSDFPDLEAVLASLLAREAKLNARYSAPATRPSTNGSSFSGASRLGSSRDGSQTPRQPHWTAGQTLRSGVTRDMAPPSMNLIRSVLQVKASLDAVPHILQIVERCSCSVALAIAESLRVQPLIQLSKAIAEVLDAEATPSRKKEHMRLQGAFAIRNGRNGYLDVARKTLSENMEDMHKHLSFMREKLDNSRINLVMNAKRGYHFSSPTKSIDMSKFSEDFVQVQSTDKLVRFSTDTLVQLNSRVNESLAEIWTLTDQELGELMDVIWAKGTVRALHRLCDSVALLDAMLSLVSYCSLATVSTIRPLLTNGGPIAIKAGHHPILANKSQDDSVPNDIFLGETSAMHIVTGRNNSGKSTFMRAVALQTILAHTGCNVPAEFASFRLLQNLCCRFNTSDDISASQSHHSKEMQEIGAILRLVTMPRKGNTRPHTLVLVDEVGRATAPTDGFSIAYAVAEKLASTANVLTIFATHFLALGALKFTLPVVKTFHLATVRRESRATWGISQPSAVNDTPESAATPEPIPTFTYKVVNGIIPETCYGIEAARAAGIPETVVQKALAIRPQLPVQRMASAEEFRRGHLLTEENTGVGLTRLRAAVQIAEQLAHIKASRGQRRIADIRADLVALQNRIRSAAARSKSARTQNPSST